MSYNLLWEAGFLKFLAFLSTSDCCRRLGYGCVWVCSHFSGRWGLQPCLSSSSHSFLRQGALSFTDRRMRRGISNFERDQDIWNTLWHLTIRLFGRNIWFSQIDNIWFSQIDQNVLGVTSPHFGILCYHDLCWFTIRLDSCFHTRYCVTPAESSCVFDRNGRFWSGF